MRKIFLLTLFCLIFFLAINISAVKPEPQIISNGCEIRLPQATTLKQNQDIKFHTHVINTTIGASNFLTNDTTTCFIHLYNHSGHTLEMNLSWDTNGLEWELDILGENFSTLGEFAFYIQCKAPDVICADSGTFEVTPTGYSQTTAQGLGSSIFLILMVFLTFLFLFIGFKLLETEYLWVIGIFFLLISIFFIIYDVWLGVVYHLNYMGANNASVIPTIIFYLVLLSLGGGLLISGILLFKKLPKIIEFIKGSIKGGNEDGWDGEDF